MFKRALVTTYFPQNNEDENGIIRKHKNIIVSATAKVNTGEQVKVASNVLNSEKSKYCWYSPNEENSEITISFESSWISISNYSIRSPSGGCTQYYFPKEWKVEGFDSSEWREISSVTNSDLNSYDKTKVFNIDDNFTTNYLFQKFKFIGGKNYASSGRNIFAIQAIDFFGFVFSSQPTCFDSRLSSRSFFFSVSILLQTTKNK